MSDAPQGSGWWLASDGKYYPPQPDLPPPPRSDEPVDPSDGRESESTPSSKRPRPLLVVGVAISVLLVVGIVAALIAGDGEENLTHTASADVVADSTTTTAPERAPSTTESPATTEKPNDVDLVVAEAGLSVEPGYDGAPRAVTGAAITNNGSVTAAFFEVIFTFKDAAGTPVGTETTYVYAVDPGGTAHAAVEQVSLQADATQVEASVVPSRGFMPYTGTVIPVTVTAVGPASFGGLSVAGTAANPTNDVVDQAAVHCVLRRGGEVVGGVYTYLDTMVPGGDIAWETSLSSEWVTADAADCSAGFYQ